MHVRSPRWLCAALVAALLSLHPLARPVWAQNGDATKRVEGRYQNMVPDATQQALPMPGGMEKNIEAVPLPDFVKESDAFKAERRAEFLPPPSDQSFDLEQSVRRGLDANPQMQSARAIILGAEAGRLSAMGEFGPTITAGYSYQRTDAKIMTPTMVNNQAAAQLASLTGQSGSSSSSYQSMTTPTTGYWQNLYTLQLQATQPLFTGFKLLSTYQKAALAKDQAEARMKYTELSLIKTVQKAFLSLLKGRSDVKSAQDAVTRLESQYKVTQAFYDVGLKPRVDVLQAEAELAKAEQNLLRAQNSVLTQLAQLNSLLNLPLEEGTQYLGELEYLPFGLGIEKCLDTAYKERPDVYIGIKSVEMAGKDAKIAASPLYPQLQGSFIYQRMGDQPGLGLRRDNRQATIESTTVGLTAQWQVWDWGSTYFGYRQARENVKKLQADLAKLRLDVGYEVKTYYLNIQDAAKRISVARTGLEAAREGYRMAVARYQAQVGTNTDVLDAQARVSESEFNLTQAMSDYQSALADLYAGMGVKNMALVPGQ